MAVSKKSNTGATKPTAVLPTYFDESSVKKSERYVAWLDVMGTRSWMRVSHGKTVNFVMKLHLAVLHQARPAGIGVFPMNDGVFVTSVDSDELTSFVNGVMATLFREFFKHKDKPEHQFVVRGAIAYGPVSFGSDLAQGAQTLQNSSQYTSQIILGAPLAQAVDAERQAPPFGIYVHESARWFGNKPLKRVFHRWFAPGSTDASHVKQNLPKYFQWIKSRPVLSGYSPDRVAAAILLLDEYLLDV